jgi:hypothetical protein
MTDTSSAISQQGINRLEGQAAGQVVSADTQLALTPYEYGTAPGGINPHGNPTAQDQHPSAQRLATPAWQGKTGTLNRAQAAQDRAEVWVTVPVDKVETKGGSSTVSPVWATPTGYQPRPGESAGSIPPTVPAGNPY